MLIIAGLGNPGSKYAANRHNIGFMAVDVIHRRYGFSSWSKKFKAEIAEGDQIVTEGVQTLRPGGAVRTAARERDQQTTSSVAEGT